jgi:predicted SnoaL-like aldol condensation-catalyzing enzyme
MVAAVAIGLCGVAIGLPAAAQTPVEPHPNQASLLASPDSRAASNKRLAFDFWREVVQAHDPAKTAQYLAPGYVEHDPNGTDAFISANGTARKQPVKPTLDDLVMIVAEGDYVTLAFRRALPDLEHEGQTYTSTWLEMVRIANGKIAEHWNYALKE